METLGLKIREARLKMRLTQKELALNLDVTDKTISRWEGGLCSPRLSMIRKIEALLKIKL